MRPRTFILLIAVLIVGAIAAVLIFINFSGNGSVADVLPGGNGNGQETTPPPEDGSRAEGVEPGIAIPSPTPDFQDVVIARVRLPAGTMITEEMVEIERRPASNIALQGGYTFTDTTQIANRIARVEIARGQEILSPMITDIPTDVASFGSDLSLFIPAGEVSIAFPINSQSGIAYAMRPGDQVDVLMTLQTVEIDPEFRSALPNKELRVSEAALLAGQEFLFDPKAQGRLEFVPELNQVAAIVPGTAFDEQKEDGGEEAFIIPKRVTQLTVQQAEVLWVGTWTDPRILEMNAESARQDGSGEEESVDVMGTPTPIRPDYESFTDPTVTNTYVILSLSAQEALTLKWAREQDGNIDLALRSPEDNTVFTTVSVSLPQIIDQGALAIPEPMKFDLVGNGSE